MKKFIGEIGIKKFMDILSNTTLFPRQSITNDDIEKMWDMCDKLVGSKNELNKFSHAINEENRSVTIRQFLNDTDTEVTLYGNYFIDGRYYKSKFDLCGASWDKFMFSGKSNIEKVTFDKDIDLSESTDLNAFFLSCTNLKEIIGLENLDTSAVTIFNSIFKYCSSLKLINLTSFDTHNAENMSCLFMGCQSLVDIQGIENFLIEQPVNISSLFTDCKSLNNDTIKRIEKMKVNSNVNNTNYLFTGCDSITSLDLT